MQQQHVAASPGLLVAEKLYGFLGFTFSLYALTALSKISFYSYSCILSPRETPL